MYDGNSNATKHTDRLAKATTYQYDALDRPISIAFTGDTIIPTWDAGDRVTKAVDVFPAASKRWLMPLNLVCSLKSDGTNTYTFDARHHLTAISGAVAASFVYDAFGRRMKKVVAGTTTQFL